MGGYFKLKPWGPDLRRAWELVSSIDKDGSTLITDFDGHQVQVLITLPLIREALHLGMHGIPISLGNLFGQEKAVVSTRDRPTFDELRRPQIKRVLQLYMQHFNLSQAQRHTRLELRIASLYTQAFLDPQLLRYDISALILKAIQRVLEHKAMKNESKAKHKRPLYLGGPLMLARIAYHALGMIQYLPEPLVDMPGIPFLPRPYVPAKKGAKRKQESGESERSTPSNKKTKKEPESEDSQ